MEKTREKEEVYPIWIDHNEKVVSFKSTEGFERMDFSSREERIAFAFEKSSFGYRVQ